MSGSESFSNDLAAVGVIAASPWDLVNSRSPYGPAVPVLLKWLRRSEEGPQDVANERFREGIVRSLAVREAKGPEATTALLREFHRANASSAYRWAVGNALEVVAHPSGTEELLAIARDPVWGQARQMVVLALARLAAIDVVDTLVALLDDEEVVGHAAMALGRLKESSARAFLQDHLDHESPWVRKEVRKALDKLA